MKNTKIICTLGPTSNNKEILKEMMQNGMNVARFNMSHGTHESHLALINEVRKARAELGLPVAIMIDTKGPEIRVRDFEDGGVTLQVGKKFTLTTNNVVGNIERVAVTYNKLPKIVKKGTTILLNDGAIELCVVSCTETDVITKVVVGGYLSNKKSINIPSVDLEMPFISEQDRKDIEFACKVNADLIAISFVNKKEDVLEVRKLLAKFGRPSIKIISKIESRLGVANAHDILEASDGIMVARGDLGVEVDFAKIPVIQKQLITECNTHGKLVVTATQMMESMTNNNRPTRAEISDVANAIFDGTNCIMLSGETSAGKHPALVVKTMAKIACEAEQTLTGADFTYFEPHHQTTAGSISYGVCALNYSLNANAIVCIGDKDVVMAISNYKPNSPILAIIESEDDYHQLAAYWGVVSVLCKEASKVNASQLAKDVVKAYKLAGKGDNIIVVSKTINSKEANNIVIEKL